MKKGNKVGTQSTEILFKWMIAELKQEHYC